MRPRKELPEGWEWKRLDEIAEINSRFGKNAFDDDTEVTFLPMRCVEELSGKMDTSLVKTYGEVKTGYTPIQEGDLLFAKITPCIENGKIAIARNLKNGIGFASTEFHTLKFSKENDTRFFFFYLMQEKIRQEAARNMTGTAGQQRVPVTFLQRLKVPVPPLPVQRQIVAVLERAEALKRQRQEADALTGALLQSVFYEMFGDPVRNERGWDTVKIRDIIEETQYGCSVLGTEAGQYPIIGMNNITYEGKIDLKNLKYVDLSEQEFKRFRLEKGDILFNRTNAPNLVGKTGIFQEGENFVFASYLIRLKLKKEVVNPEYLWKFLNSPYMKSKFSGMCKKAVNQANINAQELQRVSIPLPPLALQQEFARVVTEVERIHERQAASGREIGELSAGLMARAFSGELVS